MLYGDMWILVSRSFILSSLGVKGFFFSQMAASSSFLAGSASAPEAAQLP
jgi:hypothetical protein